MAIIFIALIIINWIIYHKLFDVVYFRLGAGLFKEFAICLFLAGIEMAIFASIGKSVIAIILVIAFVVAVGIGIKNFVDDIKKHKKFQENLKATSKSAEQAEAETTTKEVPEE